MNENRKRHLALDQNYYYIPELEAKIAACEHYREKVDRAKTEDIHERCKHLGNLGFTLKNCNLMHQRLIAGESGNYLWKQAREVLQLATHVIGEAAIWLAGIAECSK